MLPGKKGRPSPSLAPGTAADLPMLVLLLLLVLPPPPVLVLMLLMLLPLPLLPPLLLLPFP